MSVCVLALAYKDYSCSTNAARIKLLSGSMNCQSQSIFGNLIACTHHGRMALHFLCR